MAMDTRRATQGTGPHTGKGASTYGAGPKEAGPQPHGQGPQAGEGNHPTQGPQRRWRPRRPAAVEEPQRPGTRQGAKNIHQIIYN